MDKVFCVFSKGTFEIGLKSSWIIFKRPLVSNAVQAIGRRALIAWVVLRFTLKTATVGLERHSLNDIVIRKSHTICKSRMIWIEQPAMAIDSSQWTANAKMLRYTIFKARDDTFGGTTLIFHDSKSISIDTAFQNVPYTLTAVVYIRWCNMNDTGMYMKSSAPKAHIYDLDNYLQRVVFCSIDYISMPGFKARHYTFGGAIVFFVTCKASPSKPHSKCPLYFDSFHLCMVVYIAMLFMKASSAAALIYRWLYLWSYQFLHCILSNPCLQPLLSIGCGVVGWSCTIYPIRYAHLFRCILFWYHYHRLWLQDIYLAIFVMITSLALGQSYDCPSASEVILKDMG